MGKILGLVPVGSTRNRAVPEVIRQADGLQAVFFGILQDPLRGLGRITGAGGQLRMNMQIIIKTISDM